MTDTEALDLIEHCRWAVSPRAGGGWVIKSDEDSGEQEIELARTRESLRKTVRTALRAHTRQAVSQ